jgi:hypothetical protein
MAANQVLEAGGALHNPGRFPPLHAHGGDCAAENRFDQLRVVWGAKAMMNLVPVVMALLFLFMFHPNVWARLAAAAGIIAIAYVSRMQ